MSRVAMTAIEPDGVGRREPPDALAEVGSWRLHQKAVVIGHQAVGVRHQTESVVVFLERFEKADAIVVITKYFAMLITACGHMVNGVLQFDADGADHGGHGYARANDVSNVKS